MTPSTCPLTVSHTSLKLFLAYSSFPLNASESCWTLNSLYETPYRK